MIGWHQFKRTLVVVGPSDVQEHRSVPGQNKGAKGRALQLGDLTGCPCRLCQLQRGQVVVREQLGVVGDPLPGNLLDPVSDCPVSLDSGRAWELAVGHLAGQGMPEGILRLPRHRGVLYPADEGPCCQVLEVGPDHGGIPAGERRQRPWPEDGAHHRRVLQQRSALGGEGVEAGGDQTLDGIREQARRCV